MRLLAPVTILAAVSCPFSSASDSLAEQLSQMTLYSSSGLICDLYSFSRLCLSTFLLMLLKVSSLLLTFEITDDMWLLHLEFCCRVMPKCLCSVTSVTSDPLKLIGMVSGSFFS